MKLYIIVLHVLLEYILEGILPRSNIFTDIFDEFMLKGRLSNLLSLMMQLEATLLRLQIEIHRMRLPSKLFFCGANVRVTTNEQLFWKNEDRFTRTVIHPRIIILDTPRVRQVVY